MGILDHTIGEEIVLKLVQIHHAEEIFQCVVKNRDHLKRYVPFAETTKEVTDTEQFIRHALEQFSLGKEIHIGIWYQLRFAGMVGANQINTALGFAEIGYWLAQDAQGKGVMTRSVLSLMDYLFVERKLNRIEIRCAVSNQASQAIPKRLCFQLEGKLRQMTQTSQGLEDVYVYGLLKKEWEQAKEHDYWQYFRNENANRWKILERDSRRS
ncbi:GNAT family N-acetyltransferase [Thermoflavimicrobium dichotomicum]|uniref:Ribosomal-protein-serine acetyltransferase n=1 Tax=Thermoflavimicrobium dichotomicum TaxID=46223 RepID=A0A1I3LVY3_9BACL|nr:GNAT family protein [Thermoflavimicrobium dichotomicum]SFI88616.1 ribosomal-protein-serine acetyltransferase [Thermoflavimicrobium dichotomicum]